MKLREIEIKKYINNDTKDILNYDFEYQIDNNILTISYFKNEKMIYPEVEEIFFKVIYDLLTDKVLNTDEILNKWEKVYTKYLLCSDRELNEIAVELNKYYKVKENLEFIVNNCLFLPYLKCILNTSENFKEIIFYNLLGFEELQFNISKDTEIYKDLKTINIIGEIPSTFNFVGLKKEMRDTLGITPDKLFEMKITMFGKILYEKDVLKEGYLEIKLSTNNYIEKIYRLEIER